MTKTLQAGSTATPARTGDDAALLSIRGVGKRFGAVEVLRQISLEIAQGEFLTILGESGSGKTTLLRLIAGFETTDSGEMWMAGERLDTLPPYRRRVNTVFQQYALFPHLTVRDNVAYGLRIARLPKDEISRRVADALAMVKMTAHASAMPSRISGGQQQRVALARALVNRPRLLLLDEPLSALDANLRSQMQLELKALQREVGITFVFVTHDQQEAMAMSDRIALLRRGHLEQIASPRQIYRNPASAYVASFLGQTNLFSCDVCAGVATCGSVSFRCAQQDGQALVSLRPEAVHVANGAGSSSSVRFQGTVTHRSFHGAFDLVTIDCPLSPSLNTKLPSGCRIDSHTLFEFGIDEAVFLPHREDD